MIDPEPCPSGSSCGIRGLQTPALCPSDSYQDEEKQTSCKECAGLQNKTNARTYGIIGAFSEVACIECPEGGECGPGTVRQALRSIEELDATSLAREVYTAQEYAAANVDPSNSFATNDEGSSALAASSSLIPTNDRDDSSWCPSTCFALFMMRI